MGKGFLSKASRGALSFLMGRLVTAVVAHPREGEQASVGGWGP